MTMNNTKKGTRRSLGFENNACFTILLHLSIIHAKHSCRVSVRQSGGAAVKNRSPCLRCLSSGCGCGCGDPLRFTRNELNVRLRCGFSRNVVPAASQVLLSAQARSKTRVRQRIPKRRFTTGSTLSWRRWKRFSAAVRCRDP